LAAISPAAARQPIFYSVTNHAYATQIARDWNVKASGAGFVTRFAIESAYLARFQVQTIGGALHTEYWVPAEELPEFRWSRNSTASNRRMKTSFIIRD